MSSLEYSLFVEALMAKFVEDLAEVLGGMMEGVFQDALGIFPVPVPPTQSRNLKSRHRGPNPGQPSEEGITVGSDGRFEVTLNGRTYRAGRKRDLRRVLLKSGQPQI